MALIGIDFGSASCVLTTDQNNRIETIDNEYFERKTPSVVAFNDNNRIFGTPAKNQQALNVNNTIHDFKKLFNTKPDTNFDIVSRESKFSRFNLKQITAMLLSKLKADANAFLTPYEVKGCVLAAPAYFSTEDQKALLIAASIAGLNCHNIIKETTAVAINYGFFKKFSKPTNVFFVDIGQSACQVCACKFSNNRLEIIAETSELIGGRDFDESLLAHFAKGFGQQVLSENFEAVLLEETEKLKMKMSSDTVEMSLNIKSLLTDGSALPSMKRLRMEEICAELFLTIENTLLKCLHESGLRLDEVDSIEVVGGSTRIPNVKVLIERVFKQQPRATMNQDEAVSRGCLLWFKLQNERPEFSITEKPPVAHQIDFSDGIKISQVHPNFIDRGDENLPVSDSELLIYKEIESDLTNIDNEERTRVYARNKLEELITEVEAPNGFLEQLDDESRPILANGLAKMKRWDDGSTLEYEEKFRQLEALANRRQDEEDDSDPVGFQDKNNTVEGDVPEENAEVELRNSSHQQPRSESSYDQSTIRRNNPTSNKDFIRSYKSVKEPRHFPDFEMYQQMYQPRHKYRPKPRDYILQRERERENPLNVCSPS